jgi:hypothetical protein
MKNKVYVHMQSCLCGNYANYVEICPGFCWLPIPCRPTNNHCCYALTPRQRQEHHLWLAAPVLLLFLRFLSVEPWHAKQPSQYSQVNYIKFMQQTQNINNTKESKKVTLDNKNKASWEQKSSWLIPDIKKRRK